MSTQHEMCVCLHHPTTSELCLQWLPRSQIIGRLSHPGLSIQQNNRDTQALLVVATQRFQQLFYNSTTDHRRSSAGTRAQS